jgi:ParB family chromosome partitioning protein
MLPLDAIAVGERLRTVDPDWVQGLRLSIGQIGLQTPITVGPADRHGRHKLIAGAHRLAACRELGHEQIAAVVCRLTVLEQRLVEIDENLCRRDLSALDRAAHLSERKAVYEAINPDTKRAQKARNIKGLRLLGHFVQTEESAPRFDLVAAEKMRLSDRHLRRFLRLWDRLAPDVRAPLSTSLYADKFSELSLLSRQQPPLQRRIVAALLRPEAPARSVRAALAELTPAAKPLKAGEVKLRALTAAWRRCGEREKKTFIEQLALTGDLSRLLPEGLPPAPSEEEIKSAPQIRIIEGGKS